MRALALAALAVAVAGCNPDSEPTGSNAAALTSAVGCLHFTAFEAFQASDAPTDDPWAGLARGYVQTVPGKFGTTVVFGLDAQLQNLVWFRLVQGDPAVLHYLALPGTIPFECPVSIDAGQVGSTDTDSGGGNQPRGFGACLTADDLTTLQQCQCQGETRGQVCLGAGRSCGRTTDHCGNSFNCGVCPLGGTCTSDGTCEGGHTPPPPPCHGVCI